MQLLIPSREAFMLQTYYEELNDVAYWRQCGNYDAAVYHLRHARMLRLRNTVAFVQHWRGAIAT